ncbi:hypothetical protein IV505_12190 [Pseudomonas fulva]|nr:hypothetical protein [Pseudomonas fulva]MBF8780483.1 hypothetical protein [Pseudomonas fulva]
MPIRLRRNPGPASGRPSEAGRHPAWLPGDAEGRRVVVRRGLEKHGLARIDNVRSKLRPLRLFRQMAETATAR